MPHSRFRISRDNLARFVLMVRRGYRDPPYHNWMHAFSVAHFCFLLMTNLKLRERKVVRYDFYSSVKLLNDDVCHPVFLG